MAKPSNSMRASKLPTRSADLMVQCWTYLRLTQTCRRANPPHSILLEVFMSCTLLKIWVCCPQFELCLVHIQLVALLTVSDTQSMARLLVNSDLLGKLQQHLVLCRLHMLLDKVHTGLFLQLWQFQDLSLDPNARSWKVGSSVFNHARATVCMSPSGSSASLPTSVASSSGAFTGSGSSCWSKEPSSIESTSSASFNAEKFAFSNIVLQTVHVISASLSSFNWSLP